MKKTILIFFSMLLASSVSVHSRNMLIWGNDGIVYVKSTADVESITFYGSRLFEIYTDSSRFHDEDSFTATTAVYFTQGVQSISETPEIGVCYSDAKNVPTYNDGHKKLGDGVGIYDISLDYLESGTTYYYRTYVKLLDEIYYGTIRSVTTSGTKPEGDEIIIDGHKFIDLGLPSKILWAKCNVGSALEHEYGYSFAWGEVEAKKDYSWETYKYGDGTARTKYTSEDKLTTLDAEDDAATVIWGSNCRMPTGAEFKELKDNCTWTWEDNHNAGVGGFLVTGPNGNSIFIPATGYYSGETHAFTEVGGNYWSSTLSGSTDYEALCLDFEIDDIDPGVSDSRYFGFTIRPVAKR